MFKLLSHNPCSTPIGEKIKDIDLVTYTLNGSGPQFDPFITTIENRFDTITFIKNTISLADP